MSFFDSVKIKTSSRASVDFAVLPYFPLKISVKSKKIPQLIDFFEPTTLKIAHRFKSKFVKS